MNKMEMERGAREKALEREVMREFIRHDRGGDKKSLVGCTCLCVGVFNFFISNVFNINIKCQSILPQFSILVEFYTERDARKGGHVVS